MIAEPAGPDKYGLLAICTFAPRIAGVTARSNQLEMGWETNMQATQTPLQPVIEGGKQYVIPLFQRSYSWDAKNWSMLWDDIFELSQEDGNRTHFLGSIVTMPTQSVPQGVPKYLLIDGQQRLTTIYILLATLRDQARQSPGTLADEIHEILLTNKFKLGNDELKLLPTQGDRESFKAVILNNGITPNIDQITRAYRFFEKKIRGLDS